MALPSFTQHLKALQRSGLVRSRKEGRLRTYAIAPRRLREAKTWLARQRATWEARLDRLDGSLEAMDGREGSS